MDRMQKEALVTQVRQELLQSSMVVVVRQVGLTVAEVTDLRRKMREADANFKVVKNTLVQIAVRDTKLEGMKAMLNGPTVLAYSSDPVSAAKVIVKYASTNNKIAVVGGMFNGKSLSKAEVEIFATLPSLDQLRSKIIAVVQAPATKLATILQEPAARIARVLSQRAS